MKKHIHKFVKFSEEVEEVSLKREAKEMFGIYLPNDGENIKRTKTVFRCKCGKTQTFIDEEGGTWNKTLPNSFIEE